MKNPSDRALKFTLCFAVLTLPSARGDNRQSSAGSTTTVPHEARPVVLHPAKKKAFVSMSGNKPVDKAKPAQDTTPKVVEPRATPSNRWRFTPKFQKTGKEDITYGFMLHHPF